jgi:hypothetical protein
VVLDAAAVVDAALVAESSELAALLAVSFERAEYSAALPELGAVSAALPKLAAEAFVLPELAAVSEVLRGLAVFVPEVVVVVALEGTRSVVAGRTREVVPPLVGFPDSKPNAILAASEATDLTADASTVLS